MNVLIVGFTDYNELDNTMNKLIAESECYLFNVVCGGLEILPFREEKNEYISLAHKWAVKNGAPIIWCANYNTMDELMKALLKHTDYIVIKITNNTPQIWKNFMMKLKAEGKHGTVIK